MTNPVQVTQKLEPCPFCGGEALLENTITQATVMCCDCPAIQRRNHTTRSFDDGTHRAIEAWNTRHHHDRIAELEAAVTRLTLALEMERGRGQPRGEVVTPCTHPRQIDEPNGDTVCADCEVTVYRWASRSTPTTDEAAGFPDLGPSSVPDGLVERAKPLIEATDKANIPYQVGNRLVGFILPAEVAGLSEGLFMLEAIQKLAALTQTRTYAEGIEDEVERIRDALKTAYNEGATATHYAWIDGNGQNDPDFDEAASDYAASIDIAALTPARTYQEGIEDAAKACDAVESPFDEHSHAPENCAFYNGVEACEYAIRSLGTKP